MRPLTQPMVQIISVLAILGQAFLLFVLLSLLLGLVVKPARNALLWLREGLQGAELWIAFAVALTATCGSLFFSEYSNFLPCHLCWLQRYCMYPLVPVLLLAAIFKQRLIAGLGLLMAVAGAGIASWHRYLEANPSLESQGCKAGGGCATNWLIGLAPVKYITIPTLSLTAFLLIITMLLFYFFAPKEPEDGPEL